MKMFVSRQKSVIPSKEVCDNCLNNDPSLRCPQQLHTQLCTSFEAVDAGDVGAEEERPFVRETLGSLEPDLKTRNPTKVTEPVDRADVDEEEAEEDAGN
jgi:hypothetical protein